MDVKAEDYENDSFYLELERQMVRLIENSEEAKPRPITTSSQWTTFDRSRTALSGKSRLLQRGNYYDWSVCGRSTGPAVSRHNRGAGFSGTGVFIPQAVKFELQDFKKWDS